jgi:hypothetical protein
MGESNEFSEAPAVTVWDWPDVPVADWGPVGWSVLHSATIEYPDEPTRRERLQAAIWLWGYVSGLPCAICRTSAREYVRTHPPDLSSSAAYREWGREMHNWKNRALRKKEVTADEFNEIYSEQIRIRGAMRGLTARG